uniref:Uncharacterized protein n=1 Tax=Ditylum brightwellii TaxID=49249 RepID=A0A7S4QMR8_9STRA
MVEKRTRIKQMCMKRHRKIQKIKSKDVGEDETTENCNVEEAENTENCIDGKEETEVEMQADIADTTNEKEDTDENMVQEDGGEKDTDEARENEGMQDLPDNVDSTNKKEDTDENMVQEDGGEKDIDEGTENTENCIETQGEEETETHGFIENTQGKMKECKKILKIKT